MEIILIDFDKETVAIDNESPERYEGLRKKEEQICVLLQIEPPFPHRIKLDVERNVVFYDYSVKIDPDLPFFIDSLIDILGYDIYEAQDLIEILDKLYEQLMPPGLFSQDPELFTKKIYDQDELRELLKSWDKNSDK